MDYFPIFLRLQDQSVVVVGGGSVAARKVDLLLRAGAAVTVVSPGLCEVLAAKAAAAELVHLAEEFRPEHLVGARLAIAATNRESVNAWVAHHAERLHVPVNVVDDRVHSRFIIPAIVDRSPVMVAVSSGGEAPVLTRRLRERLETLLPESLGALAQVAGRWRSTVKKRLREASARRRFWENFFDGPLAADVLAGRVHEGETLGQAISRAIARAAVRGKTVGEVTLVGAGPGDPGLLTLRGLRALQDADVVLYDRLVSAEVLDLARRDAERINVGKSAGAARTTQQDINALMIKLADDGKRVCRLKGGDPFVFGRGGEELEALARAGIPFQVVPGITAAMGCAAYAGIPLTHRDYAQIVTFMTGHGQSEDTAPANGVSDATGLHEVNALCKTHAIDEVADLEDGDSLGRGASAVTVEMLDKVGQGTVAAFGELESGGLRELKGSGKLSIADDAVDWAALAGPGRTLVVYMGLGALRDILTRLRKRGVPSELAAAVVEHGTRASQRVFTGTLATLADEVASADVQSPALLIVGEVTRLHEVLHWFNRTGADGGHVVSRSQLHDFTLHRKLSA